MHTSITINEITDAFQATFTKMKFHTDGPAKEFKTNPQMTGGTWMENIALQNIQARASLHMRTHTHASI